MDKKKNPTLFEYFGLFVPLYIMSLIIAYFYITYYIDKKIISKFLYIFCVFYFSLFVYLHFITNLDFILSIGSVRASNYNLDFLYTILDNYYLFFNAFSFVLKYIIFTFYIGYTKSGYLTKRKRIFDAFFHHYILIIIGLSVIAVGIVIFLIFMGKIIKFYGKYKFFLNYLNFLGLIELYMNIGCFFTYVYLKFKNRSGNYSSVDYLIFSEKLSKNVEEGIKEINEAYNKLYYETINSNLKNTEIRYYNFISLLINRAEENKYI